MPKKTREKTVGEEEIQIQPESPSKTEDNIINGEKQEEEPTQKPVETTEKTKKTKTRVIYKTDARYELLKDAITKLVNNRPDVGDVQRNPMLYHEWALKLERLLQ